jgi:prepilin-type N-terminal cleavage/methylation domain-containing protein
MYRPKLQSKGFTIIEVLIVLAVVGLIIVIVFMAVPALQRNSRNNARNNDATRIAAAVTECLAAHNAVTASCDDDSEIEQGNMTQLVTLTSGAGPDFQFDGARIWYGSICDVSGLSASPHVNSSFFTVTYRLEPDIDRCVGAG